MTSATLFKKLQEHELEIERLEKHEWRGHQIWSLALKNKVKDYDDEESQSDYQEADEVIKVLVKKLKKILKRDKTMKIDKRNKFN